MARTKKVLRAQHCFNYMLQYIQYLQYTALHVRLQIDGTALLCCMEINCSQGEGGVYRCNNCEKKLKIA